LLKGNYGIKKISDTDNNLWGLGVFGDIPSVTFSINVTGGISRYYRYTPRSYRAIVKVFVYKELAVKIKIQRTVLSVNRLKPFKRLVRELYNDNKERKYVRKSRLFY